MTGLNAREDVVSGEVALVGGPLDGLSRWVYDTTAPLLYSTPQGDYTYERYGTDGEEIWYRLK